jgi:putative membrane protein
MPNITMFLDILLFMFLGILIGTITGLIPGIHPNTVFVAMISMATLLPAAQTELLLVFIMALAVSNTFLDFLPSIIFGAPDPATALSVLPGHRFLLEGRGYEAVLLTIMGGLGVALLTLLTLPLLVYIIPGLYMVARPVLHALLILVVLWMILTESGWGRAFALLVFSLSGLLGLVTLNAFASEAMLFPSLTGLFAISTLLMSLYTRSEIPAQQRTGEVRGNHRKGILTGWLAGWFAGMLPGVGAAQAGVLAAQSLRASTREFLTALGGINTSNIMFTFIVFYTISKTRSGAAWAISQIVSSIAVWDMLLLVMVGITACFISAMLTLGLARAALSQIGRINYNRVSLGVLIFLVMVVALLSGPTGLLAALAGTFTGLLAILFRVRRSHLMGYLLLPTILYFSGLSPGVMVTLGI